MEFNEDGLKAIEEHKIIMLGGNHWRAAVRLYVEGLEAQMQAEQKKLKAKEAGGGGSVVGDMGDIMRKIRDLREQVEEAQFWAVRVYDRGK